MHGKTALRKETAKGYGDPLRVPPERELNFKEVLVHFFHDCTISKVPVLFSPAVNMDWGRGRAVGRELGGQGTKGGTTGPLDTIVRRLLAIDRRTFEGRMAVHYGTCVSVP